MATKNTILETALILFRAGLKREAENLLRRNGMANIILVDTHTDYKDLPQVA